VLAKMAVTVDHLSNGRLEFGIGAGWAEEEHTTIGLFFPPVRERIDRLDEACEVLERLWTGEPDFNGRYYQLRGAVQNPRPLQQPYPPIWIGGGGERRTLRVVARHADVWNFIAGSVEDGVRKSGVLDRHCEAIGRDPSKIRRSVQLRFEGDVDRTLAELEEFVRAGFTEPVIYVSGPDAIASAELLAEQVLPRMKG
jgi:alkanesulfonate monooxygenase SsuD/methylene tetrahydromethanopterin reductase-like flavin-dependent oxidoreductase (luciferase family)